MSEEEGEAPVEAVVLDYLPHGRADDDRPQYQKPPLAHALGTTDFQLYELVVEDPDAVSIGDELTVDPPAEGIEEVRSLGFDSLSSGATAELDHVVRELVGENEGRFVTFFNEAGPISLRLHQFNLLPGIGDKIRDALLDERERRPFESLDDVEERVAGLHDPMEIVVERIREEIRGEDVKYKLFARPMASEQ